MTKSADSAMLTDTPAAAPNIKAVEDGMMTPQTGVRLRELTRKTGEPFDSHLTERQARRRIAQLEEIDSLNG